MTYHDRDGRVRAWTPEELASAQALQARRRKAKEAMRRRGADCDILAERERVIRFWKECAEDNPAYLPYDGAWWSTFLRGRQWRSLLMPRLRQLIDAQEKARQEAYRAELQASVERMRQRKAEKLAAKARAASPQMELAAPDSEYPEGRTSQQVLKAEGDGPDATDRNCSANASPDGGPMGAGQPAAAGPDGEKAA